MKKQTIWILWAGARWLALSYILQKNGHKITVREYNKKDCAELDSKRETKKIPGFKIAKDILFTNDLAQILTYDIIINATPTQHIRTMLQSTTKDIRKNKIVINAAKWIELKTGKTIHQIFQEETSLLAENYFSISGASFAHEICSKNAYTSLILASDTQKRYPEIRDIFENEFWHIEWSNDILWVEIAGALKNIYAIWAGILDGMDISINTKSIFLLKALAEMKIIWEYFGAKAETFDLSCGLWDLYISCESSLSRNWQVGNRLGKWEKLETIIGSMNMVSEWASTVKIIYEIGKRYHLNLAICNWIYEFVYEWNNNWLGWIKE